MSQILQTKNDKTISGRRLSLLKGPCQKVLEQSFIFCGKIQQCSVCVLFSNEPNEPPKKVKNKNKTQEKEYALLKFMAYFIFRSPKVSDGKLSHQLSQYNMED